jgi:protein-disulfide isomerase
VVHRIGLLVASLAAVVALVVGMSVAGQAASPNKLAAQATQQAVAADPTPRVQVDTVYVASPTQPPPIVVHKTVPSIRGEDGESEGGDD